MKLIYYILLLAAFLRLYRLEALTEFLGDQGRTSFILRQFPLPLAGPTTLSGAHLGPVFYYLLAPFGWNPIVTSIWMAILGVFAVYVLYKVVNILYGTNVALIVSILYAVAPIIVKQDRIIWEPNLVPLFAFLFCYFILRKNWLGMGAATAVLVQLHYPNIFFIGLSGLILYRNVKSMFKWLFGFALLLLPFMFYEYKNHFIDIQNIFHVMSSSSGLGKRQIIGFIFEYSGRVFGFVLPYMSHPIAIGLISLWIVFLVFNVNKYNLFWTFWFLVGVISMARYNGVVYDHYLLFLLPPVLLTLAAVAKKFKALSYILVILILIQLFNTDIFSQGNNDIARTKNAVSDVINDANSQPFSFTLINSRSFSDLHYRYYFSTFGVSPEFVKNEMYSMFYLICDNSKCPPVAEVTEKQYIPVVCYDPHCAGDYGNIDMTKWQFDHELTSKSYGKIYVFLRL